METPGTHSLGAVVSARDLDAAGPTSTPKTTHTSASPSASASASASVSTPTSTSTSTSASTWQGAVDRAVRLCGSQAALARHLKVPRQHVSEARTGGRTIPTDRLPALGQLVHMTPAELWTLQEVANMPRRNPFARECEGV